MSNIFSDFINREKILLEQLAKCPIVEVTGLVDVNGVGAARIRNEHLWTMSMRFDAWHVKSTQLRTDTIRVMQKVSEEQLRVFQNEIKAESIIKILARVADKNIFGSPQALLEEIIELNSSDTELSNHSEILKKPVTYKDNILGTFTYDRAINWYTASSMWNKQTIELNLSLDANKGIENTVVHARNLFLDQVAWDSKIRAYAVEKLLKLKNEEWLEEDENVVTEEEFKMRMKLESITLYADGRFEFCHSDEDLFWGHSILVSGNMIDGPTDADIPG